MNDDFAIIAGLNEYPGISSLAGAETDAVAFAEWVKSQGVPDARVKLILSSAYGVAQSLFTARPEPADIDREFRALHLESKQRIANGTGPRLGRRLYIFFAGHGFVPQWDEGVVALLTPNASDDAPYHIAGRLYQRWALGQGLFDEVLLFMDCCGSYYREFPLTEPVFFKARDFRTVNNPRWFYATASKMALKTREKTIARDGKPHGVFTATLLDALNGKAGETVDSLTLARYLTQNMEKYLDAADLDDPEVARVPDVQCDPGTPFIITTVAAARVGHDVTIRFRPDEVGQDAQVILGNRIVASSKVAGTSWRVRVPEPGSYKLVVGTSRLKPFDVPRIDDVAA